MQANTLTASPLPDVRGVTLQYKTRQHLVMTTYRVDFRVHPGEHYILLGPSGCGKSTLLKVIGGYPISTEDKVRLKGQLVTKPRPDHMMVSQGSGQLLPWRTVKENVLFPLLSTGRLGVREIEECALHYINKINLIKFVGHHPYMLSGGTRQHVAIACGIAMESDVLLMDEPFAAPDAFTCCKMRNGLLWLWDETRFTVLLVTHPIPEAIHCGSCTPILSPHPGQVCAELPSLTHGGDDSERFEALEAEIHDMLFAHIVEGTHADWNAFHASHRRHR